MKQWICSEDSICSGRVYLFQNVRLLHNRASWWQWWRYNDNDLHLSRLLRFHCPASFLLLLLLLRRSGHRKKIDSWGATKKKCRLFKSCWEVNWESCLYSEYKKHYFFEIISSRWWIKEQAMFKRGDEHFELLRSIRGRFQATLELPCLTQGSSHGTLSKDDKFRQFLVSQDPASASVAFQSTKPSSTWECWSCFYFNSSSTSTICTSLSLFPKLFTYNSFKSINSSAFNAVRTYSTRPSTALTLFALLWWSSEYAEWIFNMQWMSFS